MDIPPRDLLMAPWLESASLAMVFAARGIGKTHFALNIAHALATGGDFLKWKTTAPVPVLYVDGELPASDMQGRLSRIVEATGQEPEPGMFNLVSRDLQRFNDMPNLAGVEGQRVISENVGEARVIILDNHSSLIHGAKENEAEGWEPVGQWAIRERSKGRTLIFVHHAGKNGEQRGSSKRKDLLDVVIKLQRPADYRQEDESTRFEVHFSKARSIFGKALTPFEAQLAKGADGRQEWTVTDAEDSSQILELQAQGLSLRDIGKILDCDASTVKRRLDKLKAA